MMQNIQLHKVVGTKEIHFHRLFIVILVQLLSHLHLYLEIKIIWRLQLIILSLLEDLTIKSIKKKRRFIKKCLSLDLKLKIWRIPIKNRLLAFLLQRNKTTPNFLTGTTLVKMCDMRMRKVHLCK
jgi:hypothetical protein